MQETIKVLSTVRLDEEQLQRLQDVSPRLEVTVKSARKVAEIPPDLWDEVEVLISWGLLPDREMAPNLRWVQVLSAGVDRYVENGLFDAKDVMLTTTSGMHAVTMAEHTLALMLAFSRRIPQMLAYQPAHIWTRESSDSLRPVVLRGATLGIVGYGSIGREVARLARAFGMQVLATKNDVMHPASKGEYVKHGTGDPDGTLVHRLYPAKALKSMLKECDYVVLLTPLTPQTENLFDAETIAAMKPGSVFVNLARGKIVDEEALQNALESGHLKGAGFDVFAEEPLPEEDLLWDAPNMIISQHMAGGMPDYTGTALDVVIENLERYLAGKELLNVVDWERGY